jgi:DNA mismatch repair protein MutS2
VDEKSLTILEYPKILDRLAGYCAFAASADKARSMHPSTELEEARRKLAETSEAVQLFVTHVDLTIGGARDIRQPLDLASHGGVLTPGDFLDIKSTLIASRNLQRTFERFSTQLPNLCHLASQLPKQPGLVEMISRTISERGEILDSASDKLGNIRRSMRIAYDRLMSRLQRFISDPKNAPLLQEALITQRDGRYVIPLRSEFKGRVRSIVHDQSASGATLFVEPLGVVEHNNEYRELQLAERDEERRILTDLSNEVGFQASQLLYMVDVIAELDLVFSRAKYAEDLAATEPVLQPFQSRQDSKHPGSTICLRQARHPLLDQQTVIPVDVELDSQTYALVITGPNTGGKTVTLKTVGLLALMAQSGLHIPAKSGSEISLFDAVYADIGDEQSIEQSLSTFSGHITNIIHIMEAADRRSLVILDELGAGTDPQEGAALARSILTHLLGRGITTLVTTHHPELKAFAHATPGVVNASVEFDLETLRPTYHLTIGLPGRSNALSIAQRLGMPEDIILTARSELNPQDIRADDLLDDIHRQRDRTRQARSAAEKAQKEMESLRSELSQKLNSIEDERRSILEQARHEAENQMSELEEELRQIRRSLARANQPLDALQSIEERVKDLADDLDKTVERQQITVPALSAARKLRLGDKVFLRTLNTLGVITSLGEEEAEVQVGALRIRSRLSELAHPSEQPAPILEHVISRRRKRLLQQEEDDSSPTVRTPVATSPGMELDLRGQRSDEALLALDRFLDSAYLAGMPFVRIIHGKGTGKLRQSVREAASTHPHVKSFESGSEKEGGEGVTVIKLHQ